MLRQGYAAFAQGDLGWILNHLDPEVEIRPEVPDWQVYRGPEGLVTFLERWFEPWEDYRIEPQEFIDAGDKVVVISRDFGRSKDGFEVEQKTATVWTTRDGEPIAVRVQFFLDRDQALEAAGLGPQREPAAPGAT